MKLKSSWKVFLLILILVLASALAVGCTEPAENGEEFPMEEQGSQQDDPFQEDAGDSNDGFSTEGF